MHHHQCPGGRGAGQTTTTTTKVGIQLLGGFELSIDGTVVPERRWSRRTAASLVKVLALAPGHRLHREQVIDILWPEDPFSTAHGPGPAHAAPRLHKAAHYARKATGRGDAVVLRNDVVMLFPDADLTVDVVVFEELARRATAERDPVMVRAALDGYNGELLPGDRYEEWAAERRELLHLRHLHLLSLAGEWLEVTEVATGDEDAHLALIRDHVAVGATDAALRQYARLERVLERDLGVEPGPEARRLRDQIDQIETGQRALSPVGRLVAELTELARRQSDLLRKLAAAGVDGCVGDGGWS